MSKLIRSFGLLPILVLIQACSVDLYKKPLNGEFAFHSKFSLYKLDIKQDNQLVMERSIPNRHSTAVGNWEILSKNLLLINSIDNYVNESKDDLNSAFYQPYNAKNDTLLITNRNKIQFQGIIYKRIKTK